MFVWCFRQESSTNRFHHRFRAGRDSHQSQIFLLLQNLQCVFGVVRRGDCFDERLGDFARRFAIDHTIEGQYAPIRGHRIRFERSPVAFNQRRAFRATAGLVCLIMADAGAANSPINC